MTENANTNVSTSANIDNQSQVNPVPLHRHQGPLPPPPHEPPPPPPLPESFRCAGGSTDSSEFDPTGLGFYDAVDQLRQAMGCHEKSKQQRSQPPKRKNPSHPSQFQVTKIPVLVLQLTPLTVKLPANTLVRSTFGDVSNEADEEAMEVLLTRSVILELEAGTRFVHPAFPNDVCVLGTENYESPIRPLILRAPAGTSYKTRAEPIVKTLPESDTFLVPKPVSVRLPAGTPYWRCGMTSALLSSVSVTLV